MKLDAVDFFYLSMPEVLDIGDGSQDALLVRVRAGKYEGWGECEAAPLPSIAAWCCPMSHSACKPVKDTVLGARLDSSNDIFELARRVRANGLDLLQTAHTWSGVEIALWDLLGRAVNEPVYKLLGYSKAFPKTPYASVLFGATPQETLLSAQRLRSKGFRAFKFGWGPFGKSREADRDQLQAAREGIGPDGMLCVDAGTVWGDNLQEALLRVPDLKSVNAAWLEEPFVSGATREYAELAQHCAPLKLASGEGCHDFYMARQMIDHAGLGYVQIDTGRVGGIGEAKRVAEYAASRGVTFVNHTFTSHLALSASLQPYAGLKDHEICEYPLEPKALAWELTTEHLLPDANGQIVLPETPGLGLRPNPGALKKYVVETEIVVKGRRIYTTPAF